MRADHDDHHPDDHQRLARAKRYPYPAPRHAYLFAGGRAYPLSRLGGDPVREGRLRDGDAEVDAPDLLARLGAAGAPGLDGRTAVLAHGSNAAPEALARKFAHLAGADAVIPVLRARLIDLDVVYATHFSSYGSIPSTLASSPGTEAEVAVTFLAPSQLAVMHESELGAGNYLHGRLDRARIVVEGSEPVDGVVAYVTRHGHLGLTGAPLALAAIEARGRRFAEAAKIEVLALVRDHLAPGADLDRFILETIHDAGLRRTRSEALRRRAQPFAAPWLSAVSGLGGVGKP